MKLESNRLQHQGVFARPHHVEIPIDRVAVSAYRIPTDGPESDGTLRWHQTVLLLVRVYGGNREGLGYSYASVAGGELIEEVLIDVIEGRDALAVSDCWTAMAHAVRNVGRPGVASMAISAVDAALWDLKAKLLDLPLVRLLGMVRERIMVYGSGGFTSYDIKRLQEQLAGWTTAGLTAVKMKVGRHPSEDVSRVMAARAAIGEGGELFVDGNGAYDRKQALRLSEDFREAGVTWFEEPVSSDDLEGLRLLRDRAPAGMDIAAGEYGNDLFYFRRMLSAGSVDVLQADATRCGGITGFLKAASLCEAQPLPLSAHCAPSLHVHPCCALAPVRHIEYFHDHVRIEQLLFDGVLSPRDGALAPDLSRPGFGLQLKQADARQFEV